VVVRLADEPLCSDGLANAPTAASCSGILRTSIRCEVSKPQFNGSPFRARLMLRSNCYVETNMLRIRFPSRRSFAALKKVSGAHVKVGLLIAAVFFAFGLCRRDQGDSCSRVIAKSIGSYA
jgi:hypothetical protein